MHNQILSILFVAGLGWGCGASETPSSTGSSDAQITSPSDLAASDSEAKTDLTTHECDGGSSVGDSTASPEIDDTPGCAADFCAASPESAPDPSTWGPFPLGGTTMTIDLKDHDGKPRTIKVEVWYPTTEEFRDGPFSHYSMYEDAPPDTQAVLEPVKEQVPVIDLPVVRDAPVRVLDGPYPLVIFSHGAYGVRFQSIFFTLYLASHGYVVAAPDHTGNDTYDLFVTDGWNVDTLILSAMDRPLDATALLDRMLERNGTPGDLLEGSFEPDLIGASGHSFGGLLSLYMGLTDPRIKAMVAMCPKTTDIPLMLTALAPGNPGLSKMDKPTMIMAGGMDHTLNTEEEMRPAYEELPGPKYYFELARAGHYTYSDICMLDLGNLADNVGIKDAKDAMEDGCADDNIDTDIAHPMIREFAVGFFNYYLRDSKNSMQYFDEQAAQPYADELEYHAQP